MTRALVLVALLLVGIPAPLPAQESSRTGPRRFALDTVAGTMDYSGGDYEWPTQLIFDAFAGAEVYPGWQVSFRPLLWRVRGEWEALVGQLSIRYTFRMAANWRVEVGRFASPIGLGMTENRPSLNAGLLWCHRPYYMPMPSLGSKVPRLSLMSAVYPTGAQIGASGHHWDARAALIDRAPVEFWKAQPDAERHVNAIVGGGITPMQGVRIGAASSWGAVAAAPGQQGPRYLTTNVEAEYALGYTRVSGEWTRDRFDTAGNEGVASGWTVQAQHTLTPRVFAHSRVTAMEAPEGALSVYGTPANRRYRSVDSTVGYRLRPELTLKLSHAALWDWTSSSVDHQVGMSVMWTTRWW
jgi:hypothetical protein